jgi:hypothetical protein
LQVKVEQEALDHVRQLYAPPDDPVFELVPPIFAAHADTLYEDMGRPEVTSRNVWEIYQGILQDLEVVQHASEQDAQEYAECLEQWEVQASLLEGDDENGRVIPYPPIDGQELLGGMDHPNADGDFYLGGVNNGQGLGMCIHSSATL